MTRIVIGSAISLALVATAACSGTSSTSTSPAAPSTAFSAQSFSSGTTLSTLDHGHDGGSSGPGSTTGPSTSGGSHGDDHGSGREAELEGAIVSIDAAHTSFVVRTTTVHVLTATVIRHGHTTLTFADLKAGDRVHVKGSANGAAIDAREVNVQDANDDAADRRGAEGVVAGLAGTCPAITFTVGAAKTEVATDAKTSFGRSACADVVNGASVEVEGTVQTDGSILAAHVSVNHEKDDDKD